MLLSLYIIVIISRAILDQCAPCAPSFALSANFTNHRLRGDNRTSKQLSSLAERPLNVPFFHDVRRAVEDSGTISVARAASESLLLVSMPTTSSPARHRPSLWHTHSCLCSVNQSVLSQAPEARPELSPGRRARARAEMSGQCSPSA